VASEKLPQSKILRAAGEEEVVVAAAAQAELEQELELEGAHVLVAAVAAVGLVAEEVVQVGLHSWPRCSVAG
jgi:hypothetical protein